MAYNVLISVHRGFRSLRYKLFSNWHFMRWLRLGLGLFLVWHLVERPDVFTAIGAAFFLFQAISDTGCGGATGCSVPGKPAESGSAEREERRAGK